MQCNRMYRGLSDEAFYLLVESGFRLRIVPGIEEIIMIQRIGFFCESGLLVLLSVRDG